ncbi:MAG TPA: pyridoxamine 5'-phosphate oxidase family protein [Methanolinea sp.]|jgi:hypothetical protein|nr:pyridoxamine 5'-phosphate oxidase family protein [Methanolinea sp.]HOS82678.1 pyridoxamine 5'-phosphate oxidase family protein [Methanolinea sp.]HPC55281.1 pyridoxamine 5'-phosphate oxidase family protein [Methanolinea sp.]HQE86214.1 pyridoxamine 5'-phosphate oxidase family protein [Methanolinea sp.]HRS93044.1 pyridoxamine 5'-phosphate oxidase family protein [Methanolinea sp.]
MTSKLVEYFNKQPRLGILATSGRDGRVDVAVIGSAHMTDEKTVVIGLAKNRTLACLSENPHAVYMIVEPGKSIMDWKGVRVYLEAKEIARHGPALEGLKDQIAKVAGKDAAAMMAAAVTFRVVEVRPLVDMGQGWEKSI